MYGMKLCLATSGGFGKTEEEQIRLFREVGFEGFFTGWKDLQQLKNARKTADETGMLYQSVHAPFNTINTIWLADDPAGDDTVAMLTQCLRDCVDVRVPIMVSHAFIGFKDHTPTQIGIDRFGKLVKEAEKLGVAIALENTEGEEYLYALMDAFRQEKAVGFCLDTGHEMCYNRSQDLLARFGSRLIATHVNDNLGIRDEGGEITWLDDLHLLPYDGIADWESFSHRLAKCGYAGPLTFELNRQSKPGRHENDPYDRMTPEDYITLAYMRACRVAASVLRARAAAGSK